VRVRYTPHRGRPTTAFAKVFHDPAKAAAAAASLRHVSRALAPGAPLRLPTLCGAAPEAGLVLLGALDGDPFVLPAPIAAAASELIEVFERLGAAIAALHDVPRGPLPPRPTDADLTKARRRVGQLGATELARSLGAVLDELSRTIEPTAEAELVAVHGDCKPSQVLLGRPLALLDPDHLGWGDPAGDLAQLHVALLQSAVREQGADPASPARATAEQWIDAFDAAYFAHRAGADPGAVATRVRWIERLTLVRKAVRAETRNPGSSLAHELLTVAEGS
jgi:aminoglycoside phosphotransferase (APT) family kinase protein